MTLSNAEVIVERPYKTVYRSGDQVIKLFAKDHPKTGVFNEAYIQTCVEEAGLPVPKVLSVSRIDDCWALAIEYVEGPTLQELMDQNPDRYDEYLSQFVDIQLAVNKFKASHLRNTKNKMEDAINSLKEEIDPSTRYELLQRLHGMPTHTKLCHGDFVPSNIVMLPDGGYKILDWAHATQGNAGADAAITYLKFSLDDPKKAEHYLRLFCTKSDTAIQYVQKWLPIVAAEQLTKQNPDELPLLTKWISVAEYQ